NHGRIVDGDVLDERTFVGNEITESQVLEMPDGQLKLFMRNYSGYAQIATSFDGGETWDSDVVTEHDLVAPYSQMTAIRYDGQIDGQEAVIFASAGDSTQRVNGTVRAGLINEDGTYDNGRTKYTFDWKYSQLVKPGEYGYSNLTNLNDGNIGLLYENGSQIDFTKFNPEYLKWDREGELHLPFMDSITVESEDVPHYVGENIQVKVEFDDFVMLSGDRILNAKINEQEFALELTQKNQEGTAFIFEGKIPELESGQYDLTAEFSPNLNILNVYGEELNTSLDENKLFTTLMVENESPVQNESAIKEIIQHLEDQGEIENSEVFYALNIHLTAVDHFEKPTNYKKVVKHINGFKQLLDQYKENEFISEDAYQRLIEEADHLIEVWS